MFVAARFCFAALSAALLLPAPARAVTNDVRDFLIQDVCVDASGAATGDDPYACARHRDLQLGEKITYLRTDRGAQILPGSFERFQAIVSFPVRSPNGDDPHPRVVIAKEFGGDQLHSAFNDFDACRHGNCGEPARDGYDVAEMNGDYVSFVGTSDPGINNQTFWREGCPAGSRAPHWNEDSWILFPSDLPRGGQGNLTHHLTITTNDTCPGGGFNAAYVEWEFASQPLAYTSGKAMETITSTHFAGTSPERATSYEKFYFTRQYGFTRWEAWRRADQCGAAGCVPKVIGCNGDITARFGAATFVRTDCRDSADHAAPLDLVLTMIDASGTEIASVPMRVEAGTRFAPVASTLSWDFSARPVKRIRFALAPSVANLRYHADEAFIVASVTPAEAPGAAGGGALPSLLPFGLLVLWRMGRKRIR